MQRWLSLLVTLLVAEACVSTRAPAQDELLPCEFMAVQDLDDSLSRCAFRDQSGSVVIVRDALSHASFGREEVAAVFVEKQLLFVTRRGVTAPAFLFDNGADYFVEGLARTVRAGKIGFVDTALREVIPPTWDFAFPFSHGVARVCTGCRWVSASPGGEHREVVDGKWGYINRAGLVVVPVIHDRETLPSAQDAGATR